MYMKTTRLIMGMPITVELANAGTAADVEMLFDYFRAVDERYSTYKPTSEISRINNGLPEGEWSSEMRWVLELCEATKHETGGYFDIKHAGRLDPSGLVKGWAIQNAANMLLLHGHSDFYIEAGGDVQAYGRNARGKPWRVGIRNPFRPDEIVKVLRLSNQAIATSGAYIRGDHIYNPLADGRPPQGIASLSIVASTIYDADRFATAAYAMGREGIAMVEQTAGLEGYMIDDQGVATLTTGFEQVTV